MGFQISNEGKQATSIALWQSGSDEQHQWWRTRPSWTADSWAFEPQDDSKGCKIRRTPHSYLVSLPSAIHLGSGDDGLVDLEELRLDSGLVGVRLVEEAIQPYEKAVGFPFVLFPKIEQADLGPMARLNLCADEDEIMDNNKVWSESLQDFISSVQDMATPDTEGSMSSSFIDSELSSGSDNSNEFFAMPATPVHAGSVFSDVLVKSASPDDSFSSTDGPFTSPTPRKSLNAFASSFVPSFSPPAHSGTLSLASITDSLREKKKATKSGIKKRDNADSLSSFTFPTLNPPTKSTTRLTTVKIKKDDQGFFSTDVQLDKSKAGKASSPGEAGGPERPSQLLLPPFLQEPTPRRRPRPSRTRELVDQLRSDQTEATSPLSTNFDDANLKGGLGFPFDLVPKSASTSHSPSPIDDVVVRPRSSVSEDGAGQRGGVVDGRESQSQSGLSTPSLDEDDEGWIDLGANSTVSSLPPGKRARDLFLAFTRRRTDSISSEPTKEPLPSSEHVKTKSQDVKPDIVQESRRTKEKPVAKALKPSKKSQWGSRDRCAEGAKTPKPSVSTEGVAKNVRPNGNGKPTSAPTLVKPNHRKKPAQNTHGRHHSAQGSTTLSANAARFNPSGPAFPSLNNPPYVNVPGSMPMLPPTPSHMSVVPTAPAPVQGTFFFNSSTPAYHPLGMGSAGVPPMPGVYAPGPVPVGFVPVRVPAAPYAMPPQMPPHAGLAHHRRASSTLSAW